MFTETLNYVLILWIHCMVVSLCQEEVSEPNSDTLSFIYPNFQDCG